METLIILILLALAIPTGLLCKYLTKFEKKIYKKTQYFPLIKLGVFIFAIVFSFLNLTIALTLTWMFIFLVFWDLK